MLHMHFYFSCSVSVQRCHLILAGVMHLIISLPIAFEDKGSEQ